MAVLPGRLRRRLTIAFVLVAGVSTAALAIGSYLLVQRARFDDSLSRASSDVHYQLVLAQQFLPLDNREALLESFRNSGRQVFLAAPESGLVRPQTSAAAAQGQIAYERTADHRLIVGGQIPGATTQLYVIYEEARIHQDLAQLRNALAGGWILIVILAALIGRSLARRTLEPVGRASNAALAVAEGLLATRLPVQGRDEFGTWAEYFNRMAEALEAKIARERQFTADVAHELRTPVTALVAAASLLREHLDAMPAEAHRPAQLLVADVVRLRHLVDELMEISRLDGGRETVTPQRLDLLSFVNAIVLSRGWEAEVTGDPAPVDLDPRRLERVVANLIANAVEHGRREVRVLVSASSIKVTDRGPGIAPEHLPHLFERFYKADRARGGPGSGLGLAIAHENARLLGGELHVSSEPGTGSEFTFTLPVTKR